MSRPKAEKMGLAQTRAPKPCGAPHCGFIGSPVTIVFKELILGGTMIEVDAPGVGLRNRTPGWQDRWRDSKADGLDRD